MLTPSSLADGGAHFLMRAFKEKLAENTLSLPSPEVLGGTLGETSIEQPVEMQQMITTITTSIPIVRNFFLLSGITFFI